MSKSEKTASELGMGTSKILMGAMQLVAGSVVIAVVAFLMWCGDTYATPYCNITCF